MLKQSSSPSDPSYKTYISTVRTQHVRFAPRTWDIAGTWPTKKNEGEWWWTQGYQNVHESWRLRTDLLLSVTCFPLFFWQADSPLEEGFGTLVGDDDSAMKNLMINEQRWINSILQLQPWGSASLPRVWSCELNKFSESSFCSYYLIIISDLHLNIISYQTKSKYFL